MERQLVEKIKEKAKVYFNDQLELLERVVSIDSGSRLEKGINEVADIFGSFLVSLGAEVSYIYREGIGNNVVARIKPPEADGKILIVGHMDTVFLEGDTRKYPFRIDGEYVYGLGAADMKGGIVTALYALKIMHELKSLPNKEIVIVLNADEEIGSQQSRQIMERELEGVHYAFVFEPSRDNGGIITERKGVGGFTVEVFGREAHSGSQFEYGKNAVVELADKILKMNAITGIRPGVAVNVAIIEGGNKTNIVPGYAKARASVRVDDIESMKLVEEKMKALENDVLTEGINVKVSGKFNSPPMKRTSANLELYNIAKRAGQKIGLDLEETKTGGTSDACYLSSKGIGTIDGLGPYKYNTHEKTEHILMKSLLERTMLFAVILSELKS
ncbi:MAG TPA: M20 family metallopeptidase [Clostridia bacterium]|nr:M20 family metallopeptidase [Clostridia bacterium]